jgi:hypothetical protein
MIRPLKSLKARLLMLARRLRRFLRLAPRESPYSIPYAPTATRKRTEAVTGPGFFEGE